MPWKKGWSIATGKSLSEALIFASNNLQFNDRLFIELFMTFGTIFVHNMFSPCSAKRRASEKNLPIKPSQNKKGHVVIECPLMYISTAYYVSSILLPRSLSHENLVEN